MNEKYSLENLEIELEELMIEYKENSRKMMEMFPHVNIDLERFSTNDALYHIVKEIIEIKNKLEKYENT